MLTSDLIHTTRSGTLIKPCFIDPQNRDLLDLADNLILLCRRAVESRLTREVFLDSFSGIRASDSKSYPVNSLLKLLEERIEFQTGTAGIDHPALRRELFLKSAQLLADGFPDEQSFSSIFPADTPDPYGDLPEFDTALSFKELTPKELLERYNTALVQAILLKAEKMTVVVGESDPAELRRMLKYLKFFRLLADISKNSAGSLKIEISGPFSLFGPTRKYALNLAAFLPAVLRLGSWKLRAEVKTRSGSSAVLKLDDSAGLVSHYRHFSAYVPEEIRIFHQLFNLKSDDWEITGDTPVLLAGSGRYLVPDLSFKRRSDSSVIHLELFHRWHRGQMENRLEYLERKKDLPLIIGIDRAICDEETAEILTKKYPGAMAKSFRFRDFPGVDTVLRKLNS
ncbi:MAG: DUF790 family protein [Lentisphaeria bacterium]|nr:DUF790 family protein [Lentisphaeria bacterium]